MGVYIVGVTGASGSIYAMRMLEALRAVEGASVHLVMSAAARQTVALETQTDTARIEKLADVVHNSSDLAAPIASGSFKTDGMIVVPCSIKTASDIAYGHTANLLVRAADVCLKERRKLIIVIRESPLHLGHLRTLARLAEIGAIILPPIPAFYARPQTIDDLVNHTIARALDLLGISNELSSRWQGPAQDL